MNALTRIFPGLAPAPLMLTQIAFDKSVIHAAAQDIGKKLCANLGHESEADWDEFIASEDGKELMRCIKKGFLHLVMKSLA